MKEERSQEIQPFCARTISKLQGSGTPFRKKNKLKCLLYQSPQSSERGIKERMRSPWLVPRACAVHHLHNALSAMQPLHLIEFI